MKRIRNEPVMAYHRKSLTVVKRDGSLNVIWLDKEKRIPQEENATVARLLVEFIVQIPTESRLDSIHGQRLYDQVWQSLHKEDGNKLGISSILMETLEIEEAEWDWVVKKLEDDKIGPRLLGTSLDCVINQLKELEVASRLSVSAKDQDGRVKGLSG